MLTTGDICFLSPENVHQSQTSTNQKCIKFHRWSVSKELTVLLHTPYTYSSGKIPRQSECAAFIVAVYSRINSYTVAGAIFPHLRIQLISNIRLSFPISCRLSGLLVGNLVHLPTRSSSSEVVSSILVKSRIFILASVAESVTT